MSKQFDLWRHSEVVARKAGGLLCVNAISVLGNEERLWMLAEFMQFCSKEMQNLPFALLLYYGNKMNILLR